MKTLKLFCWLLGAVLVPQLASALVVGPYTPDVNTAYLFHFNEPAGAYVATNAVGSLASGSTNVISVTNHINPTNGAVFYRMVYP